MRTRLTLPLRFNSEKRALGVIRDNQLSGLGAVVIELATGEASRWRVAIDTEKPNAVCRYLQQNNTPGVEWQRTELSS